MNKYELNFEKFKWIDLVTPLKSDLIHLSTELNIPNRILQNALNPEHLPKYENLDSASVIYLRTIDSKKSKSTSIQDISTKITLIFTHNTLITIHRLDHLFLEDLRAIAINNKLTLKDVIKKIIYSSLFSYEETIIDLENRVDNFELAIFENQKNQNIIKEGYYLKRKASAIRKIFKFSLDILTGLQARPEFNKNDFLGTKENIERNLFYTEDVLENVTSLLNLHVSLAAQKTNEVMRVLTVFSIFFLPLNFLAGLYGMNFDNMPELHSPKGYYYLLSTMMVISIFIYYWVHKKGWLKRPN